MQIKIGDLDSGDLGTMMNLLSDMIPDWLKLCRELGVPNNTLRTIDNAASSDKCMVAMLDAWIKFNGDKATLECLIKALKSPHMKHSKLADSLKADPELSGLLLTPAGE